MRLISPGSIAVPQTRDAYERVLAHHGQWFLWMKAFTCPCLSELTAQPDPQCTFCQGRGFIYKSPVSVHIYQEYPRHDNLGRVYLEWPVWDNDLSSVTIRNKTGSLLTLGSQPPDHSYIQLATWPFPYEPIAVDYEAAITRSIVGENPEIVKSDGTVMRVTSPRIFSEGKAATGSIEAVSRVHNVTKVEDYTPTSINRDFIYFDAVGTWVVGDVLEVDYTYAPAMNFVMHSVTEKMKYEKPYVGEEASAVLITPYYIRPSTNDVFSALSQEQAAQEIIDPTMRVGNDILHRFFDVSRIEAIVQADGSSYDISASVELFGRNEIKWKIAKPTTKYIVHFTYHPTYRGLPNLPSVRHAENKSFIIRTGVTVFDRVSPKERPDLVYRATGD
jgi:hypothetical protein